MFAINRVSNRLYCGVTHSSDIVAYRKNQGRALSNHIEPTFVTIHTDNEYVSPFSLLHCTSRSGANIIKSPPKSPNFMVRVALQQVRDLVVRIFHLTRNFDLKLLYRNLRISGHHRMKSSITLLQSGKYVPIQFHDTSLTIDARGKLGGGNCAVHHVVVSYVDGYTRCQSRERRDKWYSGLLGLGNYAAQLTVVRRHVDQSVKAARNVCICLVVYGNHIPMPVEGLDVPPA